MTDATITIPDGYTLDGAGHTITAVDPPSGHFLGAVVANAGATAHVKNLHITTSALLDVCDAGADRLRGIM
ncbi:MAG: right-handed parallel beta-helix repeat-containing protein, partial [Nitrososphaerales archaeon]